MGPPFPSTTMKSFLSDAVFITSNWMTRYKRWIGGISGQQSRYGKKSGASYLTCTEFLQTWHRGRTKAWLKRLRTMNSGRDNGRTDSRDFHLNLLNSCVSDGVSCQDD